MRFSKAIKLLERGMRVRKVTWDKDQYVYFDKDGILTDENGDADTGWLSYRLNIDDKWEEYIGKQVPIEDTEETEERNCGIQDRLSMILENQNEIKAGIEKIVKMLQSLKE